MAVQYPNNLNIRLTDEDVKQLEEISKKLDFPPSTLVRRVWREWLQHQLTEEPPAA